MTVKSLRKRTDHKSHKPPAEQSLRDKQRRLMSFFISVGTVVAALVLSGIGYELILPGVGDAQARVAGIVRSHHGKVAGPPLPPKLANAVVAVEDKYFYSNVFVNVSYGVARAAFAALRNRGDPGGSTIDQQLAKELYPHGGGLSGKLEELGLGIKLALVYSKAQILNMYLNVVSYGNGYRGDAAAARGYFGVDPNQLSWAEATLLAGLPQAPSLYDPLHHFRLAKKRQSQVIDQLVDNGYLTNAYAMVIYREPLQLKSSGAERGQRTNVPRRSAAPPLLSIHSPAWGASSRTP